MEFEEYRRSENQSMKECTDEFDKRQKKMKKKGMVSGVLPTEILTITKQNTLM